MTIDESLRRSRRIHVVSFAVAFVVFCLAYFSGLLLFTLGSLAMHGPKPWHHLPTASVIGSLAGGMVGLTGCLLTRTVLKNASRTTTSLMALPWIPWVAVGILSSILVDEEILDRSLALPFYVVPPGVMLGATVSCILLERLIVRRQLAASRDA